ncbi:MAG: SpoIIE family protein phosphatase [Pseudomonadota bacterium]
MIASLENDAYLTVLLVEDNPVDSMYLSKILRDMGHVVLIAQNGEEALEMYEANVVDLAIIDLGLPDMSGSDLARRIQSDEHIMPLLITTGTADDDVLSECYDLNAGDFLMKPYVPNMVRIKLRSYQKLIHINSKYAQQRDVIVKANRDLVTEQRSARRVFDKLSQNATDENEHVRYNMSALSVFNGDVVLTAKSLSGELYIFLGDFTGHGLVASLSSVPLVQTFSRMVEKGFSMADVLQEINSRLNSVLPRDIFCCGVLAVLNPRNKQLRIWNGGLPDCYLYSVEDNTYKAIKSKHLPLGVLDSEKFCMKIDAFSMKQGDRLLMCSDGILEARNSEGEMFGTDRILNVLDTLSPEKDLFDSIAKAAEVFTDGELRDDDMSLVEVVMPEEEPLTVKTKDQSDVYGLEASQLSGNLNYVIDADMIRSGNPVTVLMQLLLNVPGISEVRSELFTAITELYANALDHGILNLDSSLKRSADGFAIFYKIKQERLEKLVDGNIRFVFDYVCDQAHGNLNITVEDSGKGFDVVQWRENFEAENNFSGRGLSLIQKISTTMDIIEPGNKIEIQLKW